MDYLKKLIMRELKKLIMKTARETTQCREENYENSKRNIYKAQKRK